LNITNKIVIKGFKIIDSGEDLIKNIGAVRLYDAKDVKIENNIFKDNYFGVYLQRGDRCQLL